MSRRRLFGSLCSMVVLVNLARVVFAPLVSEFIAEFGVNEAVAGGIVTLVWVGSALPRLPTGYLLTRVPRHHVVLATGGILTLASGFTAAANSVTAVSAGALLMGLASGVYFVAANPLVSELYPTAVGRAMGIHGTAAQVAAVGAAPLVSLVVLLGYTWRAVFVAIGVAALVSTLFLFLAARRTDLPTAGADDRDLLGALRSQWRFVLVGVAVIGLTGFVWQGLFNFYELYMRSKGLAPGTARNLLTVVFAAGVPAFFLSGRLADRFPHVPYVLAVMGSFAAALLALTTVSGLVGAVVLSVVVGLVIHSLFPALDTYLLGSLPDEHRGSAYAAYSASMMLVQAGGASAVGRLVSTGFSYDAVFGTFALGLGVVVLVLAVLDRSGRLPG